ncbi:P22AR C-terminal domain-containing protein [Aeromonas sp. CD]|uniref:P22AR C-terminal domain-containing protein n=1 Tax=Aeromonas sp. CD TaxID=3080830 RepID=UPI0029674D21|nr:P22AR C-terminal domain-containing protein [Aeromonas sp. CD]WOX51018.1 P22AR C-terminal domain-containing protein [Aeromonas sp. CD]
MNSISFHDTQFTVIPHHGQPWLTAAQIAQALGYAREDAVSRIYARNIDEFTSGMTGTVNLTVPGNPMQIPVRIFSLRGAHLIAMFSRTALAKEFRRWVLDVLDRETAVHPQPLTTLSDDELHSLAWLWRAADYMMGAARRIYPLLEVAEHREAGTYYSIIHEYPMTLAAAQRILADKTRHIQSATHSHRDWNRLIPHLHRLPAAKSW